jgi:hypothetical protein
MPAAAAVEAHILDDQQAALQVDGGFRAHGPLALMAPGIGRRLSLGLSHKKIIAVRSSATPSAKSRVCGWNCPVQGAHGARGRRAAPGIRRSRVGAFYGGPEVAMSFRYSSMACVTRLKHSQVVRFNR